MGERQREKKGRKAKGKAKKRAEKIANKPSKANNAERAEREKRRIERDHPGERGILEPMTEEELFRILDPKRAAKRAAKKEKRDRLFGRRTKKVGGRKKVGDGWKN